MIYAFRKNCLKKSCSCKELDFTNCTPCNVILCCECFYDKYLLALTPMMIKHFCISSFNVFLRHIYISNQVLKRYILCSFKLFYNIAKNTHDQEKIGLL